MRDIDTGDASLSQQVTDADTAERFGADFPPAAATPFVLGLSEVACHSIVKSSLDAGETTVGLEATIRHLTPSPVGASLTAHARLTGRKDRILTFSVTVMDGESECAQVSHTRAVVLAARINQRLAERVGRIADEQA